MRPRLSITVAVNIFVPAVRKMPVASDAPVPEYPPPAIDTLTPDAPAPAAYPLKVNVALDMPCTYNPQYRVMPVAVSVPAVGITLAGIVSVIVVDVLPDCPAPSVLSVTAAVPLVDEGSSPYHVALAGTVIFIAPGPVLLPVTDCPPMLSAAVCV